MDVLWAYGQRSNVVGDSIKKPMRDCTGGEMFAEMLYHCGLVAGGDRVHRRHVMRLVGVHAIHHEPVHAPQGRRPAQGRFPDGCVNLAFIGQFVELPGDVVFTVETSVRTAMMAVWGLTGLDKPMVPLHEPRYDVRVVIANLKAALGIEELGFKALPALVASAPSLRDLGRMLKNVPPIEI